MAEHDSGQERTEQPTPKRLEDARKKGQVLRSREFNTLVTTLGASTVLLVFGSMMGENLMRTTRQLMVVDRALAYDTALLRMRIFDSALELLHTQMPLFLAMLAVSFLGPAAVGGIRIGTEALNLKPEHLDPVKGVKRMFSLNSLIEVAKSLLKVAWLGTVAWLVGSALEDRILALGRLPAEQALPDALWLLALSLLSLSLALVPIAAIDVPHQIWQHINKLKMTRQEVRDELKEVEGNPELKSRIRQQQREIANRRMMEEVPHADVVITNPTHFAVALRYDPNGANAPTVVAKGVDHVAERIRAVARSNDITLFEAPPLARALYWSTDLGQSIPAGLYVAVARILAYVYQLRGARRPYDAPARPTDLPVPDEFLAKERR
jgi:flagellar biosynthetic protein FlhB